MIKSNCSSVLKPLSTNHIVENTWLHVHWMVRYEENSIQGLNFNLNHQEHAKTNEITRTVNLEALHEIAAVRSMLGSLGICEGWDSSNMGTVKCLLNKN